MRRWTTAAFFGVGMAVGWARGPRLPEALVSARTACLEGKTGDARDANSLAKELREWGRLRLGIRGYCDVTFALQHAGPGSRIPGARDLDSDRDYLVFTVWNYRTGGLLYRDVVEWPLFVNPVHSAVKRLRLRIERQEVEAGAAELSGRAKPD